MKLKEKKGFVFIETIVVISVVLTSLITIYSLYVLSNTLTLKRLRYDDVNKLYQSFYVQKYLSSLNLYLLKQNIDNGSEYELIFRGRQDLFGSSLGSEEAFFETMWEDLKIRTIILVPYDISYILNECQVNKSEGLCPNKNLIDYLKTLDTDAHGGYRLIFEFASNLEGNACPNFTDCFYFYTNIWVKD